MTNTGSQPAASSKGDTVGLDANQIRLNMKRGAVLITDRGAIDRQVFGGDGSAYAAILAMPACSRGNVRHEGKSFRLVGLVGAAEFAAVSK